MHVRSTSRCSRLVTIAAVIAAVLGLLFMGPTSTASATSTPVAKASEAQRSITRFRGEMRTTLQDYLAAYAGRLSRAEYTRVSNLTAKVDRDLGTLAARAAVTTQLARSGNRKGASRAATAAVTSYQRSYDEAIATLAEVQPILQPKLGLFEALEAKADLDTRLDEFRAVGEQLKATSAALR